MPYAKNGDVKINYEVEGEGPPLVLAHGATADLNFWRRYGYVDALKSDYTMILFDMRGHGKSDKPHDHASYTRNQSVEDIIAVLDDIGLNKVNYFGFSLSALFGYLLAIDYRGRFDSFLLMGMNPLTYPAEKTQATEAAINTYRLLDSDPDTFMKEAEKWFNRTFTSAERERFLTQDGEALATAIEASFQWSRLTEKDLARITSPCLIISGEIDPNAIGSEEAAKSIVGSQFVSLPGFDHKQSWERSDITLPQIKEFLSGVTK